MIVGLTGGIATGKSTVSKMLKDSGVFIIDVDLIAREVVEPGTVGLKKIVAHFGSEILFPNSNELNRKKLGSLVFNSKEKLDQLNQILQPIIRQEIIERLEEAKKIHSLVVVDMPLLFEEKYETLFDQIIVVTTQKNLQIDRLKKRNHLTEAEALQRIHAQLDMEYKEQRADLVIDNSGSFENAKQQVQAWLDSIANESDEL